MNCKSKEKRQWIVQNYYVYPVSHLKLLNGQYRKSDADAKITDHYYIFNLVNKKDKNDRDTICCGYKVARHFQELTGKNLPKLFSPLKNISSAEHNNNDNINDLDRQEKKKWNETRLQLYNAVMLIITLWDVKPNTDIFTIKYFLENEKYIDLEVPLQKIKGVNTILKSSKTTLREQLNKISLKNKIKEYKFDLLVEILKKENIKQYFEKE